MHACPSGTSRTRQVAAAVIGNALEWYDFIVYGFLSSRSSLPATSTPRC